ncbi:NERD domain-containing protein [Bacillus sp. FJAT-49825]|uniref:NERD domain-containing protein n=1 Tax=Neobacillus rhizophilus TaxID=2833579 RepID=A0A942UFT3_9BACI|nr:NERD domain-containing protein [Neobacillus rhizophilus]
MWSDVNLKPLAESKRFKIYRSLNTRMELLPDDRWNYQKLKSGFEGEMFFQSLTDKLQCDCYVLHDLLFELNGTTFQIDSLIIFQDIISLNEVKNFTGDFFYEDGKFYDSNKKERKDPLAQLDRCESMFRQLLEKLGFKFIVVGKVVHVNPEFTLYQAPREVPIIFPTQLNTYMRKLEAAPVALNNKHRKFVEKLLSLHQEENPYSKLPPYAYCQCRKGLTCANCLSFEVSVVGQRCVCVDCGHEEKVESAILRHVEELRLLFPDFKITTNLVFEWCGGGVDKKRVRRILEKKYKRVGVHQWTYYE